MRTEAVASLMQYMTPAEKAEVMKLLKADKALWRPLPGPQSTAYHSDADIIGYGGAAGGGKTDLACGKAVTQHKRIMILRREATQLTGIIDRLEDILGSKDGYNGQAKIWRLPGRQIEFGSVPNAGDVTKYQGRPHDLLVFDEATNFLAAQVRFLLGWLRTTTPGQRCQALLTFNPPTDAEGRWVIEFFAPWLDDKHPNPAKAGELRWFATYKGADMEVPDGTPFVMVDGERVTDFKRSDFLPTDIIKPMSRTFIPSRINDNPYLTNTGYMATLQSMPEPLRSQMLKGDFMAGVSDDPWQVIPTDWIDAAQARWTPRHAKGIQDSLGVDPSRGGGDKFIISPRYGQWFDELIEYEGLATPDGPTGAGYVIMARRDRAPVHIDIIGWGAAVFDFLVANGVQTIGLNNSSKSFATAKAGQLKFANLRAELHWMMREALDPTNPNPIYLPPDKNLRADLAAPKWKPTPGGILIESKDEIKKRIGRSPDRGDAVINALRSTPKAAINQAGQETYDPWRELQ